MVTDIIGGESQEKKQIWYKHVCYCECGWVKVVITSINVVLFDNLKDIHDKQTSCKYFSPRIQQPVAKVTFDNLKPEIFTEDTHKDELNIDVVEHT